jgi:molybdopterin molybdotransferase
MIELAEAQARLFALRAPVEGEKVALVDAAGRWAASDVVARRTQPARDLSAMDGYAIRAADAPGPWRVIGESAAGRLFDGSVGVGQAVRIFTGAVVPDGADCILIQENATRNGDALTLACDAPVAGQHIRRTGADFAEGALLIAKGEPITPARIALAAMGGHATLPVARELRVAIISTGDELVAPGAATAEDQIPSSNAPMLAAMLAGLPVEIDDRGIIPDDLAALTAEFQACAAGDIIVSIGGASVGDHDLVKSALEAAGAKLDFWKIAMRPGKPVMAGMLGDAVVLGLPGNPVSAFVTAFLLLKPLIARLSGASDPLPERIEAQLAAPIPANGNRLDHIRGILTGSVAMPTGANDSSMLAALSKSNILIIRHINAPAASKGDLVPCLRVG